MKYDTLVGVSAAEAGRMRAAELRAWLEPVLSAAEARSVRVTVVDPESREGDGCAWLRASFPADESGIDWTAVAGARTVDVSDDRSTVAAFRTALAATGCGDGRVTISWTGDTPGIRVAAGAVAPLAGVLVAQGTGLWAFHPGEGWCVDIRRGRSVSHAFVDGSAVALTPVPRGAKAELWALLQEYLHEIEVFEEGTTPPGEDIAYPYFDAYWEEPSRHALYIELDDSVAGFVLVRTAGDGSDLAAHGIAEFYVRPGLRGRGVGRRAAFLVFDRFPGPWELTQLAGHERAQAFWGDVVAWFTAGDFEEDPATDVHGPVQRFHAGASLPATPGGSGDGGPPAAP